jgi:hypothetical protein
MLKPIKPGISLLAAIGLQIIGLSASAQTAPPATAPAASAATAAPNPAAALLGKLRPRVEPLPAAQVDEMGRKSGLTSCFWIGTVSPATFNILIPDTGVTYWGTQYRLPPGARIELTGRYPYARHLSFNTYDEEGQPVDRLNDLMIAPDPGATNPFHPGAQRQGTQRSYQVRIEARDVVAGKSVDEATRARNTLYAPGDGSPVQLWLRIYVPDSGRDAKGGVPLPEPRVTLADGRTLEGEALCNTVVVKEGALRDVRLPADVLREISALPGKSPYQPAQQPPIWTAFFNPALSATNSLIGTAYEGVRQRMDVTRRGGFYSTLDNTYMSSYVDARFGDVLVLRGKAPTTPRTMAGTAVMEPADLRYWSICKYRSLADTAVDDCLFDEQVPRAGDGQYTIVVSHPAKRPANARAECGVAWLPWGAGDGIGNPDGGFLVLRHMMPSSEFAPRSLFGTRKLGDEREVLGPYYPEPTYMSREAFERNGCGR